MRMSVLVLSLFRPPSSVLPNESVRMLSAAKPSISTSPAIAIAAEVIQLTLGRCRQEPPNPRACIHMTTEKEEQIDKIIEKLGGFLNDLSIEHEHFDIQLIKLAIDQHSEDEVEKETVLQLSVNDCQNDAALAETDHRREKAGQSDSERETAKAKSTNGKKPSVMYLELGENGQKLVDVLDKKAKRPRLVYVQKDDGQLDYLFYKKK